MAKRTDLPDNISSNAQRLCAESEKSPAKDDPNQVIALLEKALEDSPGSRSVIIKLAYAYLNAGSSGKAVKLLESADIDDDDTEFLHQLANAYAERKWNKKAVAKYSECLNKQYIYPELIQDFAEFLLDIGDRSTLISKLTELAGKISCTDEPDTAAACVAMLYSALNECILNNIQTDITDEYLSRYIEAHPEAANTGFFTKIINALARTPNDISIIPVTEKLFSFMKKTVPSAESDFSFLNAVADFEVSLILFNSDVTPLTVLAMRTAKLKFAKPEDDKDYLAYLIFSAKISIIDILKNNTIKTNDFIKRYPYLWSLIKDFITGALNAKNGDLSEYTRNFVCSDLKNASPRLIKLLEDNVPPDKFNSLKNFLAASSHSVKQTSKNTKKILRSEKIPPNAQCPCGSGKKYKKCCGLK